jgi:hypothetical protein
MNWTPQQVPRRARRAGWSPKPRTAANAESAREILDLARRTRILASVLCEAEKKRLLGVADELEILAAKRAG